MLGEMHYHDFYTVYQVNSYSTKDIDDKTPRNPRAHIRVRPKIPRFNEYRYYPEDL